APSSGDILALANYPPLGKDQVNPCVNMPIEPYSLTKFVVVAGAINEGVVNLDDVFNCEAGKYAYGGQWFSDREPFGEMSVRAILSCQSQIGYIKIASKLGNAKLREYFRRFGFGERAGIHLAGEATGSLSDLDNPSPTTLGFASKGEGIEATP